MNFSISFVINEMYDYVQNKQSRNNISDTHIIRIVETVREYECFIFETVKWILIEVFGLILFILCTSIEM